MPAFDLSRGAPLLSTVPFDDITGVSGFPSVAEIIAKNSKTLLYKGSDVGGSNFKGYGPLREVLAEKHGVEPDQIIIRNGGMDAMTHVLQYLVSQKTAGEEVLVATEVPTYDRFPLNLKIHGLGWTGVPITDNGLNMERLTKELLTGRVKLFYGIYEGQNPSSYSYTDAQMRAVETLCAEHDALVLWDGAYHHLTYGRSPRKYVPSSDNVIVQMNYTKEISAGFKCGYLVVPKKLAATLDHIISNTGLNPNYPTQAWIHAFITSPKYPEHLEKLRTMFAPKAQAVIAAVKKYSPEAEFNESVDSGYFIEINYPGITDRKKLNEALLAQEIVVSDSAVSYTPEFQHLAPGKVRLPFATLSEEEIDEVCRKIATAHELSCRT